MLVGKPCHRCKVYDSRTRCFVPSLAGLVLWLFGLSRFYAVATVTAQNYMERHFLGLYESKGVLYSVGWTCCHPLPPEHSGSSSSQVIQIRTSRNSCKGMAKRVY